MSVTLIIPAYNEYLNLTILIDEINNHLSRNLEYEIIVVDDCSNDNTEELFKNNKFHNCIYFRNPKNLGQSHSILNGVKRSNFDIIITIDADLQNNPNDILNLYNIYIQNEQFKLVGGIRYKRKDSIIKIISSKIANNVRRFILDDDCPDTGCSLKIFDKRIFLSFQFFDGIHRFLPALFKGFNYKTKFVRVDHRSRKYGHSKYGTIDRLFRGINDLFKVKKIIKNYNIKND
jgi:dolichol-phosphate mannosyltransferase